MKIKIRWPDLLAVLGLSLAIVAAIWVLFEGYSL